MGKVVRVGGFLVMVTSLGMLLTGCVPNVYKPGWDYYGAGDTERAVQHFAGTEGRCEACLCKILVETGQYEKAVKHCEMGLDQWLNAQRYGSREIQERQESALIFEPKAARVDRLCTAYEQTGQFGRAIEVLKQYLTADHPNDAGGFARLSYQYLRDRRFDEAVAAAKRAIELQPKNAQAYNNLAYAYSHKNRRAEALGAMKQAAELDPGNALFRANLGAFQLERDDYAGAAESYSKAHELQPASTDFLLGLTHSLRLLGRYDEAMSAVNSLIELQTIRGIGVQLALAGGRPFILRVLEGGPAARTDVRMGDALVRIDDKPVQGLSDEQLSQALGGAPGTRVTLTLERKGLDKPFQKAVTREVILLKEAAGSLANRSLLQRAKGNREGAWQDAQKAVSLDPNGDWTRLSLGGAQLDRGDYPEAIKTLFPVKGNASARLLEATAYARQGNASEAVGIYAALGEEQFPPGNAPLMAERAALLQALTPYVRERRDRAKSLESRGQYREALAELSEALRAAAPDEAEQLRGALFGIIRRSPSLAEMSEEARRHALRGELLIKEGNFAKAEGEFKQAIRLAPYTARLYYNMALLQAELKRYPEAIRQMRLYLQAAPDAPDLRAAKDEIIKWELAMEKGE